MNEILLIENVRNHDCLFNLKSQHYRDQNMRQEAWEEIAKNLGSTVASVRSSWTKVRNSFINAKKRREIKSGQGTIKVVPWKYERELSFLLPYLECRQTQSNLETLQDKPNIIHDENLTQPQLSQSTDIQVVSTPVVPQSSHKKARLSSKDSSLNPALEMVHIMKENAEARNERRNKISSNFTSVPHLDEVDMFYLSMAKTVKRLTLRDQAYIRMEFCRMVSQTEIRNLEERNPLTPLINTTQSYTDNYSTSSSTSFQPTPLQSRTDLSTLSTQNNCPPPVTFSTSYSSP